VGAEIGGSDRQRPLASSGLHFIFEFFQKLFDPVLERLEELTSLPILKAFPNLLEVLDLFKLLLLTEFMVSFGFGFLFRLLFFIAWR